MKRLSVHIDEVDNDSSWITGYIGDGTYEWYAKVEDERNKKELIMVE